MSEKLQQVLIIDDEPSNLTILGNLFGDAYQILVALDGETGLKIARSAPSPPDVILLDIIMPEMDGYEVCRILQADRKTKNIPVIFITALHSADNESKGLALGAVDYIKKPFNNAIVKARVQFHLHLIKQRDQLLRQQRALDRIHQRNRMILETASEGIFGIDTENNITFMNPAALRMIGFKESEVLGKSSCSIMHHTKADGCKRTSAECIACQTIRTETPLEEHHDLYWRKNNTSFSVTFSAAPAFENGVVVGAVIVFKDITRRKQLEQQLHRSKKIESFQVLAGGIAHDFNNLLTIIIGTLDLILWERKADNKLNKSLQPCKEAAMVASDLAAKFLTIAKNDHFPTNTINIKEALNQVIASLPTDQHIEYEISIPDNVWPLVANPVQSRQLLENILTNGQESMPDGGQITIKIENCPDCAKKPSPLGKGRYLQLSFQDQGYGIPEELKEKVLDPYFSTKTRGIRKGVGLGMTICNAIMQQHHGWMDIETKWGQGTTIFLYFPVIAEKTEFECYESQYP